MDGTIVNVYFDLLGAIALLLGLIVFAVGLVFFTSRYWKRRLTSTSLENLLLEEQLQLLLDSLPEGALLASSDGRVLWYNPEARHLLSLNDHSPKLNPETVSIVQRVAKSRQSALHEIQLTAEITLKLRAIPFTRVDSHQAIVFCLITNVSERHQQEVLYRRFIRNISHELFTPLTAMRGHVFNLRDASDEEVESKKISLTMIEREVERLTSLTSSLLLLSRLEAETSLHWKMTNVGLLVEQVVSDLYGLAQRKEIEIVTQGLSGLPRISADPGQLKQVFINLVSNAIKHCPPETSVFVRLRNEDERVVFEVQDDGPGIPPEDQPHIFEKMYRVQKEGTRNIEGSGLGLSIVKRIVDLHNGEITLESKLGEGTKFSVLLPKEQINHSDG